MSSHADIDILLDGKSPDELGVKVGALTIHEALAGHASFTLECIALDEGLADAASGSQAKLDALFRQIGLDFKVTAYCPDRQTARQKLEFSGLVTDARSTRQRGGGYTVILEGRSRTILMDLEPHYRYGHEASGGLGLQDWLKLATSSYGNLCSLHLPANPVVDYGMQFAETDFNFVARLAERAALWCYYDGAALQVTNELPAGEVQLTMGPTSEEDALDSFSISSGLTPGSCGVSTFDPDKREALNRRTDDVALSGQLHPWAQQSRDAYENLGTQVQAVLAENHMGSAAELNGYVENLKKSWASHLVHVHGTSANASVRLARRVALGGLADTQGGNALQYVVSRVSHYLDVPHGNYSNEFEAFPASTAFPRWAHQRPNALQMFHGTVVEDQDAVGTGAYATARKGQVKVHLFGPGPDGLLWARVAQPYAGAGGGFFAMPEVGDEVLVAFVEGDPSRPVVVGSVYNKNTSKVFDRLQNLDKNMGKGFLTLAGNKILVQDDQGKESILISTPDEKNLVRLTADGGLKVEVVTKGDLSLSADGKIDIKAGGDITVDSGGAIHVHSKADTELNADGKGKFAAQQPLTLSSNGDVKIDAKGKGEFQAVSPLTLKSGLQVKVDGAGSTVDAGPGTLAVNAPLIRLN